MTRGPLRIFLPLLTAVLIGVGAPAPAAEAPKPPVPLRRSALPEARAAVLESLVPTKMLENADVLRAMMRVDRSLFLPNDFRPFAWSDCACPIGRGRTAASPLTVALMLEALDPQPSDKVLEAGAGCGCASAILALLTDEVYAVENDAVLGKKAAEIFKKSDDKNIRVNIADFKLGWPEEAPFDKILVSAALDEIPQPLADQLVEGGVLVAAPGGRYHQFLYRCVKKNGVLEKEKRQPVCLDYLGADANQPSENSDAPLADGRFESESDLIDFWYGLRGVSVQKQNDAPEGHSVLVFDSRQIEQRHRKKDTLERLRRRAQAEKAGEKIDDGETFEAPLDELTARQRRSELLCRACRRFALDGRKTHRLEISCQMAALGLEPLDGARLMTVGQLVFYNENREEIDSTTLFSLRPGDMSWREKKNDNISVPRQAREGELRLGIFNGLGVLKLDDLRLQKE